MKTFETEKGNIPEGATHYMNESSYTQFAWGKINCFGVYTMKLDEDEWCHLGSEIFINGFNKIPQTKEVEWANGLPPVGVECEWIGGGLNHGDWGLVIVHAYNGDQAWIEKLHDNSMHTVRNPAHFRKPETEAERKEREELEAAYDLFCTAYAANQEEPKSWHHFSNGEYKNAWLAIVRKTNYKVNGE